MAEGNGFDGTFSSWSKLFGSLVRDYGPWIAFVAYFIWQLNHNFATKLDTFEAEHQSAAANEKQIILLLQTQQNSTADLVTVVRAGCVNNAKTEDQRNRCDGWIK